MKVLFLLVFLGTATLGYSQKYALVKMSSITPVKFSDTITKRDIRDERFPIERLQVDSTITILKLIQKRLDVAQKTVPEFVFEYAVGNLIFNGIGEQMAYGVRMNVTMSTNINGQHFGMYLCRSS